MFSERTRPLLIHLVLAVMMLSGTINIAAQSDPDPNSPTPVLISVEGETRVFAYTALKSRKYSLARKPIESFPPNSRIVIFVGNLSLIEGEGAGAFRVYAEDAKGQSYRFPVLDVRESADKTGVYALTLQLTDDIGYWPTPETFEGMTVRVAWRGLTTNQLLLGFNKKGAEIDKRSESLKPSPLSSLTESKIKDSEEAPSAIGYRWSGDRIRFMEQATFGPTVALDQRLRRLGLRIWLGEQFNKPYPSAAYPYPDIPLKSTDSDNVTIGCGMFTSGTVERRDCDRTHYSMYPLQNWFYKEALYGDAQLRHRVTWALSQIWVTSGVATQQSSWAIAYHKILSQNAFGNYRTLMKEMTMNPAMGNYLDMARSTRTNPNENYAREILQLFAVGLFELNIDGTLKMQGGSPIPTYTQDTVNNFTKVFTGWTFCNTTCASSAPGIINYKDPLILTNQGSNHDLTAKTLFNYSGAPSPTIAACTGCTGTARETYARNSMDQALDNIFNHPNVGPFVSKIMIQHLVTSDPSPAYVARVANIFNNNGSGVRGDLRALVYAILLDPEARGDVKTDPNFGKLREPVQLLTNLFRQVGVKGANLSGLSDGYINPQSNNMAQNVFNSPTVFNYFAPDNMVPGTTLLGPEFALMTTGTSIARANSMNTMIFSQIGVSETAPQGTSIDFTELQALATADTTSNSLMDTLNSRMMHGTLTPEARESIRTAVNAIPATTTANFLQRAKQAVYLVATSAQFQVQR